MFHFVHVSSELYILTYDHYSPLSFACKHHSQTTPKGKGDVVGRCVNGNTHTLTPVMRVKSHCGNHNLSCNCDLIDNIILIIQSLFLLRKIFWFHTKLFSITYLVTTGRDYWIGLLFAVFVISISRPVYDLQHCRCYVQEIKCYLWMILIPVDSDY